MNRKELAHQMWRIAKDEAQKHTTLNLREWKDHQPHVKKGWRALAKWHQAEIRRARNYARAPGGGKKSDLELIHKTLDGKIQAHLRNMREGI